MNPNPPGSPYGPSSGQTLNPNAYAPPGNPYGDPYGIGPPQPKQSRWWLWLLIAGGGALALLCCGCGGIVMFGFNILESSVETQIADDPVIRDKLGDVESVELDFIESVNESERSGDEDALVFHIKGSKGSGTVIGEPGEDEFINGKLRMPSGEEFPLGVAE